MWISVCKCEADEAPKAALTIQRICKRKSDVDIYVLVATWKSRNTSEIKRHQKIQRERQCNITRWKSSIKEKNIMKNIEDFHTVVSSVFTTEFNYAIKTDVKNERNSGQNM